ncbi:MAG TPA: patatin family protein [Solirubrobacterales bacterium]|nr:patatin family protein [Solirubrobacterales bacterium]
METLDRVPLDGFHPVTAALKERPPGSRLALVVEGGGMRGSVSGGMALALDELGLGDRFDAAYGSSAGALNAMWLLSGRVRDGMPTWTDPGLNRDLISWRRLIGKRPIVDVERLVDHTYERLSPGLFASVLASRTELHPIATEVSGGRAVDLNFHIRDEATLREAIRASATLPLLAGDPVTIAGTRYLDAGLSSAIPLRAALADGATHVVVLRSRREGEVVAPPTGIGAKVTSRLLSRIDPAVAGAFLSRAERELEDERQLASHDLDPAMTPHVLSIRPAADSAVPSRLERDVAVIEAGLEAGRLAAHRALGGAA